MSILETSTYIPVVTGAVAGLALYRHSGTVTGSITVDVGTVFSPDFVRTAKGCAWVDAEGAFTYSPLSSARRAAGRADAAFLGNQHDTFAVIARDADGRRIRIQVTVAIFAG
jgi:hypothetical protein